MKKLNITKEQYQESKYFQKKYGKLTHVSESGNTFRTSKGKLIKFANRISESWEGDGEFDIGDKVWWSDPEDVGSGWYIITEIYDDGKYDLESVDGGETEHEIDERYISQSPTDGELFHENRSSEKAKLKELASNHLDAMLEAYESISQFYYDYENAFSDSRPVLSSSLQEATNTLEIIIGLLKPSKR